MAGGAAGSIVGAVTFVAAMLVVDAVTKAGGPESISALALLAPFVTGLYATGWTVAQVTD
jgi:hypothetical protein